MDTAAQDEWSRRKLLAILGATCLVGLVLLLGLVLAVREALGASGGEDLAADPAVVVPAGLPGTPTDPDVAVEEARELPAGPERRAALASAPMLSVPPEAYRQGTPSTTPAPAIEVPVATTSGPAGVRSGFPQTPEGAVAQLAAIDTTVLHAMSIPVAHDVHAAWSQQGAAPAEEWVMTDNVRSFLDSARQMGQTKGPGVTITAQPVGGQVKGTDGDDWVVACVLLDIRAVITDEARVAYGHCEAMAWDGTRWVIAAGPSAAPGPSTWPGTDLAAEAGWRTWTSATGD
ncbi:hypothetical protein [Ornithinimicrobium cavernae]|uniref:hypothetical protein n=1 Tax=Ornithinimicrobium cavernae TaxID=2666047 RepID=UPI000D68EAFC|nr:hypothetical protein [Ornithinimicrobium cavernae]